MPRTEEQYNNLREKKRQLIIDSAIKLFAEKGFASASINSIAKEAGISKGLIYNYFESKEELIITIINNGFNEFIEVFDPNNDGVLSKDEFIYFIDKVVEILKKNLRFWKLYFLILAQPEVLKLVEDKFMEMLMPFMLMISNYFETKGHENPMAYTRFFGAMLDGVFLHYVIDPDNFPIDDTRDIIIKKFI